jgi:phage major head subunit gpT-like protein
MLSKYFHKSLGAMVMVFTLILASVVPAMAGQSGHSPGWAYGIFGVLGFGMIINTANLQALFTTYNTVYNKALAGVTPQHEKIALVINANVLSAVYPLIEEMPAMREWTGDRIVHGLKAAEWTIKNKPYELTVSVPRRNVETDTHGLLNPRFQMMAGSVAIMPDILTYGLMPTGFVNPCYDGKAFYANNHIFGSNKSAAVLSSTSWDAAIADILGWKKIDGSPFFDGTEKFTLVVGPKLRGPAKRIVVAKIIVEGGAAVDNLNEGAADLVVTPQITSATQWFISIEKAGLKPFIFQSRKTPQFVGLENPTDPSVFFKGEFTYGVDADWNAGYTLPWLSWGSTGLGA